MSQLSRWPSSGFQLMSILEKYVQHRMASKEICWDLWKQGKINLFSHEQQYTMIYNNLKIFSQNVWKNSLIVNTILETQSHFDIIFIQEPPWSNLHMIPSPISCKGEVLVGTSHHPNWLTFARTPTNQSDSSRVLAYIVIRWVCGQTLARVRVSWT